MPSIASELGIAQVREADNPRDVLLIFGAVAPILVLHLRALSFTDTQVGSFLSLTLVGDVLLSLLVTWTADSLGRRRVLAGGALLMAMSGVVFYSSTSFVPLLLAAVVGVVSPTGNEIGPFVAVEIGILSQLVRPDARVFILTHHSVIGFVGTSVGALLSGWIVPALEHQGQGPVASFQAVYLIYTIAALVKFALSLAMSPACELDYALKSPVTTPTPQPSSVGDQGANNERQPLLDGLRDDSPSQAAQSVADAVLSPPDEIVRPPLPLMRLAVLCVIFSLDSFASSVLPQSFISYYFRVRYNAPLGIVATTFSIGSLVGGLSQLAAGAIARRLGIILTMVGTHIPAQIFTIAIAFAPSLAVALTLFIARATIASMDAGVRGAFLTASVPPASRTRFLGIMNVCKTIASAPGPTLTGQLASMGMLRWSFAVCGGLKIVYDIALLIGFMEHNLQH
ncbi:hypothetical protein OIO90_006491 [Microbotryomycetes sp. JL221]|nr:hypothetical protein OIO90_006491 [Microbotryomycetes sp. JL221]